MARSTSTSPAATAPARRTPPLGLPLLRRIYSCMLKSRMLEERARTLQSAGKLAAHYHSVIGQEATEIGTTLQLIAGDTVAPSRHNLFTYVAAGAPISDAVSALISGNAPTPRPRSPRVIAPMTDFAAQLNIATGVALANSCAPLRDEKPGAVLAFAGDEAAVPAAWKQSLALAGSMRLPIVYVLENTLWSDTSSSRAHTPDAALIAAAESAGIHAITVDGNDAVAVFRVAHEALHRARLRRGATFIDARTSPWRRSAVTDAARPRTQEEIEHWEGRDPLAHMELYMSWYGVWSNSWKLRLVEQVSRDIDNALSAATRPRSRRTQSSRSHR